MKPWLGLLLTAMAASTAAQVGPLGPNYGPGGRFQVDDVEEKTWQELDMEPPAFPGKENLIEFYVSAVATNAYFIDASTLAVGSDGIVRYVLVVKTSGGATNVSFEGINCKERLWKHYATGDNGSRTWTKSRASRIEWRSIENKPVNRHHAALSRDYFCPRGSAIYTADEGRNALRLGKHPNAI